MMYGFIVIGTSGVTLVLLSILFRIENKRSHRVLLTRARCAFDDLVLWCISKLRVISKKFGTGALKSVLHYIVYILLRRIILTLIRFEKHLFEKQHKVSSSKIRSSTDSSSHLGAIAEHKQQTTLSAAEKKRRRAQ